MSVRLDVPELSPRQQLVLRALVENYIATAEPVASAQVVRDRSVSISSATARAVMAQLTELGLLTQPHTSAGRVPTVLAFRHYADAILRESPDLDVGPEGAPTPLARALAESAGQVEALLRRAADLLSESTGQLGFFLAARPGHVILRQVHFVRLSSEKVMALLVSERGLVQSRIFEERDTDSRELERVSVRLSELIAGYTLAEARTRLGEVLEQDRSRSDRLWPKVLALGALSVAGSPEANLYLADKVHLLAHPEFADAERLRELLSAIEEKERMIHLLDRILQAEVLEVSIGAEIDDPAIRECALVAAPLGESPALGGLGVLGPVRMPYGRVIPLVRSLSLLVNRYLS
jgi:heat-inducible transcriptional repressor